MKSFRYLRPTSLDEAIRLLTEHGPKARLLAGGTDLIVRMRTGHTLPDVVIDLKRVTELTSGIETVGDVVRIGARAVMTDVITDDRVRQSYPALVEAASVVGSIQIRNRATLAGNLCNASPAADTAPALLAYGASVNVAGPKGSRCVPLSEFFTGPGRTSIARGELVTSIDVPVPQTAAGAAFGRVTRRRGVDLATINLVVVVTAAGEVRCAFGAVGPRPLLAVDQGGALASSSTDPGARREAIRRLTAIATPITDVRGSREYRQAMLDVMTERTWRRAIERLEASSPRTSRS